MKNREILLDLIKETERSTELNGKIRDYLKEKNNNLDMSIIMLKFKSLLEGNLEHIKPDEISDLIVIYGGEPQIEEEIEEINNTVQNDLNDTDTTTRNKRKYTKKEENLQIESELYNELIAKNQTLEEENKDKEETIEQLQTEVNEFKEKFEEMQNQMNRFNQMFELFRKFNITEQGEIVKVEKETINEAYLVYTIENKTEHKNTFIIEKDGIINVVSEYYSKRIQ